MNLLCCVVFMTTMLLAFLTAVGKTEPTCIYNKYSDGCSTPENIPYPWKDEFTPACNIHDICYSCGNHYQVTRYQCDKQFQESMLLICRNRRLLKMKDNEIETCNNAVSDYYNAVRLGGESHFSLASPSWCYELWATKCLPRSYLGSN